MEKDFKPTPLEIAVHRAYDKINLILKDKGSILNESILSYVEQAIDNPIEARLVLRELLNRELLYKPDNNQAYTYGKIGLLLRDKEDGHPYLDYLRKQHSLAWQKEQDIILARSTNKTSRIVAWVSAGVGIITLGVLASQVLIDYNDTRQEGLSRLLLERADSLQRKTDSLQNVLLDLKASNSKPDSTKH